MKFHSRHWKAGIAPGLAALVLGIAPAITTAADTGINGYAPWDLLAQVADDRPQRDQAPAQSDPGAGQPREGASPMPSDPGVDRPRNPSEAQTPQPQTPSDIRDPGRNVWSTPLSGIASALGISGLLSGMGLNESVSAAVAGVALILVLIVAAFFAWQFVRRRRVLNPVHSRSSALDDGNRGRAK
jgi:hypothetical protein